MSLKSRIAPHVASHLFSRARLDRQRAKTERARVKSGAPHVVEVFHDPTDPYSRMLMQILPDIATRYDVEILTHIVGPPADSAVPERALLSDYARKDAQILAAKAGIEISDHVEALPENTAAADARLAELAHYQGGMIYYGSEWYWGIDRLHYLETRLTDLGVRKNKGEDILIFSPPNVPRGTKNLPLNSGPDLHWYFSFRSPYSAISVSRVSALAKTYDANIKLRFVLPMVMRGLAVPPAKKRYIPTDTAREAHRLGIPFGKICDPIGAPVERGYAVLTWALEQNLGLEFVQSFFAHVWTKGVDAGSDKGMRRIVESAGLDWNGAKAALQNENWQDVAEANRQEMVERGVWGVPSFRIGDDIVWGQDRLWAVEDLIIEALE